jgi:hypothetical protein
MTSTSVEREQYEITDRGITHTPTGYSFTPYPGNPTSGTVKMGRLGEKLSSGEGYRPHEVEDMAKRLWAEYAKQRN